MSERMGPVSVLPREGDPRMAGASDAMLDAVDEEVRRVIEESYAEARGRAPRTPPGDSTPSPSDCSRRETLDEAEVYAVAGIPAGSREAAAVTS